MGKKILKFPQYTFQKKSKCNIFHFKDFYFGLLSQWNQLFIVQNVFLSQTKNTGESLLANQKHWWDFVNKNKHVLTFQKKNKVNNKTI